MTNEEFKYYTGLKTSLTTEERKKISQARFVIIEEMARKDVDAGRQARAASAFENDAEYKAYLLSLVEFANLKQLGLDITSMEESA